MPEVSIVIPLYNQADFIEENIESLSKQTFKDFETIVVNDGSTDNSLKIIKELQKKYKELDIKIIDQENCGLSCARNRGIKEAKSKLILPLDADDKLREDAIEKYLKGYRESNADIVIADTQNFGEDDTFFSRSESSFLLLPYENHLNYCGLYKKSVWEEVGGYKLNMDGGYEDWEFWLSCYERGYKFHFVKEALFLYRVKKQSMVTEAIKKDRFLKNKIVLNHPALYPERRVYEAIAKIYENRHNKYFFYSDKEFSKDKRYVLLEGSFIGYRNFGDILQLKEAIEFYKREDFCPVVLCYVEAIEDREYIENLYRNLDVSHIIFYSIVSYDMKKYGLKLIDKTHIENFHIYGGGFLNRYWIDGYLNLAESVINYFDIKKFTVSGQQVDESVVDKIESFFKKYPPLIFGCRDKKSFEILKGKVENLKYSFDDAYNRLKALNNKIEFFEDNKKSVLIHLNLTYYVADDIKKALLNYKNALKKIKEKLSNPKIYFIVAYNDLNVELVRDTLNTIQTLEEEFKEAKILDFASLAMKNFSLKIPKNSIMLTSSYHLAMFAKVYEIPVFLFSQNDYYSQKREALEIDNEFEKFLENPKADKKVLKEWDKTREIWGKELKEALKGKRNLKKYDYENSFKYTFPFYNKFEKYDISKEIKKKEYLYEAWKSLQPLKEWLDELDVSKQWIENQYKNFEKENKNLKESIKEHKKWIEQLEKDKKWLEGQRSSFEKENRNLLKSLDDYKNWVKELEESKKWFESQIENYKKRDRKLENEIQKYKTSFDELNRWIKQLEKDKKWLEEQRSSFEKENRNLLKSLDEYKNWAKELEESKKWLEDQIENYKKRDRKLENEIQKYKTSFDELKQWTETLQKSKEWLEEKNNSLEKIIDQKDKNIEELGKKVKGYEEKIEELKSNRYIRALLKLKLIEL